MPTQAQSLSFPPPSGMTLGDPSLSALSVILTEDLKLAMSCVYQTKITTKRREDPEVRKVSPGGPLGDGSSTGS